MNNRLPHILISVAFAVIFGIVGFLAAVGRPTGSHAAGATSVTVEINESGFQLEQVLLPRSGEVIWKNTTTRTITITQGWPEEIHLPVINKDEAPSSKVNQQTPTPAPPPNTRCR